MFTKYSGITPPQNYSGNRFKSYPIKTEMKTHKAVEPLQHTANIKASVSPTFQESLQKEEYTPEGNAYPEASEELSVTEEVEKASDSAEIIDTPPEKSGKSAFGPLLDFFNQNTIGKFLKGLQNDDILLLALILLLAEEGTNDSSDAILILALLLMLR